MRREVAPSLLGRRALLAALASGCLHLGCGGRAPEGPAALPPPPPDRTVAALTDLLTVVKLEWLILLEPESLWSTAWLRPPLGRVLRDERLDLLAATTGFDLRQVRELALASYRGSGDADNTIAYLARHRDDQLDIERRFRERLTSGEMRSALDHQLVGVWGKLGTTDRALVAVGRDVVLYQFGGSDRSGPARIATLYARGMLKAPSVLADPSLALLAGALGTAPAKLLIPGPFDGELARGARGLLAAATAMGASLQPNEQQSFTLRTVLCGDYGPPEADDRAVAFLELAWQDLAAADLGHLLGLHRPVTAARAFRVPVGLALEVELDPATLFDGLAAATVDNVRDIMR